MDQREFAQALANGARYSTEQKAHRDEIARLKEINTELLDATEKARLVLDSWLSSNNDPVWINELVTVTRGALIIADTALAKARGQS